MKIRVISFTRNGCRLAGQLVRSWKEFGDDCRGYGQRRFLEEEQVAEELEVLEESVGAWTRQWFLKTDVLVYIGAAGIAVRAIAPCIQDKLTDPAVVVADEQGTFAISLLSGHVGKANEMTRRIAGLLGAEPVITTASDVQQKTAVDVWAQEHGLKLGNRELVVEVAAAIVDGEAVGFFSDDEWAEPLPPEFAKGAVCQKNLWVTTRLCLKSGSEMEQLVGNASVLRLIPTKLVVGIGCRRGAMKSQLKQSLLQVLEQHNLDIRAVKQLATIDLKQEEAGLLELARELGLPVKFFSAEELQKVSDSHAESEFVRTVTGVGNVCERAALLAAGTGAKLLVEKGICDGVTIAVTEISEK